MYDIFLSIPLFNGMSRPQLSQFLEKTPLQFNKFYSGDIIAYPNEEINKLLCILKGDIMITQTLSYDNTFKLVQIISGERIVGINKIYGMHRELHREIKAINDVSTIEFSKENFQRLLNMSPMALINFINILSLKSQKSDPNIEHLSSNDFKSTLARHLLLFSEQNAKTTFFEYSLIPLSKLLKQSASDITKEMTELKKIDAIDYNDNQIIILDQNKIIN